MTIDSQGNDLSKVFVPVTGFLGFGPQNTPIPASAVLGALTYALPPAVRKVGLIKEDGGFEWAAEADGDAIKFWQEGYELPSGQVKATLTVTLAQTDPISRELTTGKVPDANGVIDVDLGGNTNVYWLCTEEVAKNGVIRRRIVPNATVQSVKEDKSERGTVLGYQVVFSTNRSAEINAHYREAVIQATGATPTGVTAGTPGAFTPAGAEAPATITALRALGLTLGAAWATGQYVVIGSGNVHWDGTDWKTGAAA